MNYIKSVLKTENKNFSEIRARIESESQIRLMHGQIGISSEAGEVADAVKKHIFYGKDLDRKNLIEELGDLFYYAGLIAHELGVSFEEIQEYNVNKLEKRYPSGFTEQHAVARLDKQGEA